ncbi:hypothetical protein AAK967_02280 [Atopobiaceae bacterium 24-176]
MGTCTVYALAASTAALASSTAALADSAPEPRALAALAVAALGALMASWRRGR